MSAAAAWSTQATPLAGVAGAAVLTLGAACIVYTAITLALGGAAWSLAAWFCLFGTGLLVALRLARERRRVVHLLHWDPGSGCFRSSQHPGELVLTHIWRGPAWVTLRLHSQAPHQGPMHLVIWKSAVPPPLWSELALRIQAQPCCRGGHQNKENP